jgi:hypothetical protein
MTALFSRSAKDRNAQGSFEDILSIFHVLNNPGEVLTEVTQFESNTSPFLVESNTNPVPVPYNYCSCKKCGKLFLSDDALCTQHGHTAKRHFSDAKIFLQLLSFHVVRRLM